MRWGERGSAGVNIVDNYSTPSHTLAPATHTFSILRCGFYMDLFHVFALITFLHAVYIMRGTCTVTVSSSLV